MPNRPSAQEASVHPIEAAAQRLIGVPYLEASHQPEVGLDCAGFVYVALTTAYPALCIDLPRVRPMRGTALDALYAITEPVALHARRAGDVALLRLGPEALPHLGICGTDDTLIHVHRRIGVCCEPFDAGRLRRLSSVHRVFFKTQPETES